MNFAYKSSANFIVVMLVAGVERKIVESNLATVFSWANFLKR